MILALLACTGTQATDDSFVDPDPRTFDSGTIPTPSLALSGGTFEDADGDGRWSPGEAAVVKVDLTNTATEDYPYYPGVLLAVDNEGVTIDPDDWHLYELKAGETFSATFPSEADASLEVDTVLTFTATADVLNCEGEECPDTEPHTFQITLEAPEPADTGDGG
jgi:hypothetical protein